MTPLRSGFSVESVAARRRRGHPASMGTEAAADGPLTWTLLESLDDDTRAEVLSRCRRRVFERGELLCRQGDPGESMHLIESGRLSVSAALPSGDRATLRILGPGECFGEPALVGPFEHRTAEVRAMEPSTTLVLRRSTFEALLAKDHALERALLLLLAERVDQLSTALLEGLFVGLDRRVERRLVELAGRGQGGERDVVLMLTQAQLADLAGGTRPSVNAALQRLARAGIISLGRGRVLIHDLDELTRRAARA